MHTCTQTPIANVLLAALRPGHEALLDFITEKAVNMAARSIGQTSKGLFAGLQPLIEQELLDGSPLKPGCLHSARCQQIINKHRDKLQEVFGATATDYQMISRLRWMCAHTRARARARAHARPPAHTRALTHAQGACNKQHRQVDIC